MRGNNIGFFFFFFFEKKEKSSLNYPQYLLYIAALLLEKCGINISKCVWRVSGGEPGLVDRVLALHAGSRGFDSHRGHMSERFFRSNRPGYPHPVSSELEISGIRVAVGDCSVTERRRWRPPYQTGKTVHVHANTTNTTRTDARRRVCAAMVPYRWATRGTSLRELEYTHTWRVSVLYPILNFAVHERTSALINEAIHVFVSRESEYIFIWFCIKHAVAHHKNYTGMSI